jgi:regulator of sirC expression with transglutaminase-like and TPR domain
MNAMQIKQWREIASLPEERIALGEAALLIATDAYPDLDVAGYLARLDNMTQTLERRLRADISTTDSLKILNHYLFDELGYAGNAAEYYDPRNSYFNDVIERRLGIPITLSVLYMEIGRRIGLRLSGVSFPGHFLVKCNVREGAIVLDPYAKGASLGIKDLQAKLSTLANGAELAPETVMPMLASAGHKEILARMLRNLKAIFVQQRDSERALGAVERLIALVPEATEEIRDRGVIYRELECFRAALADFEHYLQLRPQAPDVRTIEQHIAELKVLSSRLN